ncbi:MAG: sigma-70 family RNA polymerase sigma factor [Acidimicrobiia bacterium]|nr:sigma-70 family RNA polymerase sigma factor [Acidimicrobiia bacterium]
MKDDLPELVSAARQGDEQAWSALVDRFAGLVWHVIRGFRLPNAVGEDIYQTAWLRLAENLDRIRKPESLGGWLAQTARNECLRSLKVGGRENLRDDLEIDLADDTAPVERGVDDEERDEILWQAFASLSEACQRLLRLLIADPPLAYEQVSDLLGMSIGSIGPTRARCLAKLRSARGVHLLEHE